MYKIRGADQREYGPVSAEVVRQWIADRRANAQTLVQVEGSSEWKALSDLPEFRDVLAVPPGPPPMPRIAGSAEATRNGLAIASLVLGIVAMVCLGFLTGIPAIILGHIAYSRARKSPHLYSGSAMAITGFVLGYLSIITTTALLAGMFLPALAKAKARAQSIHCVNNLKQVGLAGRMYANDHEDTFPEDFLSMSNQLITPKVLVCPRDKGKAKASDWSSLSEENISYEMVSPGMKDEPSAATNVFVRCPFHGHVAQGDGSVWQGNARRKR